MGVSTDQWRCAIGLYNGCSFHSLGFCRYSAVLNLTLVQTCLKLVILLVLLLIGCVEPHPGPQDLFCRSCPFKTTSAARYITHQTIHSLDKRFQFDCPLCSFKSKAKRSSEVHICTHHRNRNEVSTQQGQQQQSSTAAKCNTPGCQFECSTPQALVSHLKEHLKDSVKIKCPFGACSNPELSRKWVVEFTKVNSFSVHLSRSHKVLMLPSCDAPLPTSSSVSGSSVENVEYAETEEMDQVLSNQPPSADEELYTVDQVCNYIAQFYLKLEADLNVPSSTVQEICDNIINIVDFGHTVMKKTLLESLKQSGIKPDDANKIAYATFSNDPLFQVHNRNYSHVCLLTEYRRYLYYKKHFGFEEPIKKEISVPLCSSALEPEDDPDDLSEQPQRQQPASKKTTVTIVDIKTSLLAQLQDPDVQKEVDASLQKLSSGFYATERQVYCDFTDGEIFRNHPASKKPCIFLNFSCDAFGVTNPIGAAKNKHKTVGLYYVLGNLPPEQRSKVDILQLSALFFEEHLTVKEKGKAAKGKKKLRWDMCLQPVMDQLNELFATGIEYKGQLLPVYFLFLLGDNLGQHQIGGFTESFTGAFWCRYCDISDAEFRANPHTVRNFRTQEEYEDCTRMVPNLKKAVTYRGVKFDSILNKLPGFHVCLPGLVPCAAHDLAEGIGAVDMMLFIKYFIKKGWFTRIKLNQCIDSFKLTGRDAADCPAHITLNSKGQMKNKLSGSAAQNWNMIRFFSLILGDNIKNTEDPVWKTYIQLKSICEIIRAPKINEQGIQELSALISAYINNRITLFSTVPLRAKHHYLQHYPSLIRLLGPPVRYMTLRMESHHQVLKNAASVSRNFIDVTFTMAHKSQLKKAYISLGNLFRDRFTYVVPSGFKPAWSTEVNNYIEGLLLPQDAVCANRVSIHGTTYQPGMWLVLQQEGERLEVGEIRAIFCFNDVVFVVSKRSTQVQEDSFGLHPIALDDDRGITDISSTEKIGSYSPLNSYLFQGKTCLSFKHKPLAY